MLKKMLTAPFWLLAASFWMRITSGFYTDSFPEVVCGENLKAGEGTIDSPLFPDSYPPELDCTWTITARPGHRVHVTSDYLSIESQPDCLWDHLTITDGPNGEYGRARYCGSEQLDFIASSNVVIIQFHSDFSGSDAGFRLVYEAIGPKTLLDPGCNVTLLTEGTVTSPDYPAQYPSSSICYYTIRASANQKILIEFTDFQVETAPCDFDKLEVYNSNITVPENLLGVFCGRSLPVGLTSETNILTLKFVSDKNVQTKGFNATVTFLSSGDDDSSPVSVSSLSSPTVTSVPTTRLPLTVSSQTSVGIETTPVAGTVGNKGCNITVTESSSNISSPGYPSSYPHNMLCVTQFRSSSVSTFLIKFHNFSIEEGDNCTYDSLSIYEAGDTMSTLKPSLLQHLCGTDLENPIFTWEGHGLDLVFYSDSTVNLGGYWAEVHMSPVVHGKACPAECENGGTCTEILLVDGSVDWMCACPERFTGTFCEGEMRISCKDVKCENDGVCQDDGTEVSCKCPNGFTGDFCEELEKFAEGGALYFTKMVSNMSLTVGSSVILECAVNDPLAHVMWLFNDRIMTHTDWSRGVEVHPGGVVVIPEVEDQHSGRYTCMATTSGDLVEKSMWITLIEPCSLFVLKSPSNITLRVGQTAMFHCYVPDADVIMWRKDGDLIEQGPRKRILVNHYLVINPVVETDVGQYTCAARSREGCYSKVSAYLNVEATGHEQECGRPRVKPYDGGSGRISSGKEAVVGSAPWHVIIREEKKDTTFCGGSLISPDTVLTAAHCIGQFEQFFGYPFHPNHIHIYLGTHHCAGHNGVFRQLKSYTLHEHFNNTHYNNDVAILKLEKPVEFTDDIMPICLETPDFMEELLKPGRFGVVTGCGNQFVYGGAPTNLHEVQIPYVSPDICRERASSVNTSFTPGMFCAGYARSMRGDACAGDSGGPYVFEFSGRAIQAGIVSWGVGCDRENHYGYYTNIAYYYRWIMDKMKQS
ncbi:unnamed protein product [Lymnaea stagnalis]|uniref:Uncharacterized protein n=1 Tax=Lymnaea stagnalis TaxID=6523 RepID=A0AAV2GYW0_LYMST